MFTDGGLWNTRRIQHSNEETRSVKTLMNEARINNFQYSQLTSNMLRGASLSTKSETLSMQSKPLINKRVKPVRPSKASQPTGLRTYNDIVNSDAYTQPDYHPRPIKIRTDQEKDRLAHLMAYGIDPTKMVYKTIECPPPTREIDRFDELVLEIEERKQFLDQMTSLGKRKEYQQVISNEISDKIREMEQIDRQRSKALEKRLNEHRE
ncbi:unnamed protein product [Rotaria sp. Silwood2]|nr:unnamed protein product [Rotaria sp. Silwood2]CAF2510079.1 unnamed protein product [Rotaria sp. Silwood2]CAF2715354.1 unnamed protein product [Rotaria sp. Silwood2]CAF2883581.1 unnamed protein product [Rotaria sp. Silwood2]CAF3849375.1 unnamed protein product [Rotaria sp. Silwood2]